MLCAPTRPGPVARPGHRAGLVGCMSSMAMPEGYPVKRLFAIAALLALNFPRRGDGPACDLGDLRRRQRRHGYDQQHQLHAAGGADRLPIGRFLRHHRQRFAEQRLKRCLVPGPARWAIHAALVVPLLRRRRPRSGLEYIRRIHPAYCSCQVLAFSGNWTLGGISATQPLVSSTASTSPGSLSASGTNTLFISSCLAINNANTLSITPSNYSILAKYYAAGTSYCSAIAWMTSASGSANPIWSWSGNQSYPASDAIASIRA